MKKIVVSHHPVGHGSVKSYTIGFISSLVLTAAAYIFVTGSIFSGWSLMLALASLAVIQLFVQLFFFLHVGREAKPYWNLLVLSFAAGVVIIIVFGSLWIMQNLQYDHHLSPYNESDRHIIRDEGYQQ